MLKKVLLALTALFFLACASAYFVYSTVKKSLPEIIKIEDYKPLLVSHVYDRNGKKVGEFFRERRQLIPYKEIPEHVVKAFLAAEDDKFFEHRGINLQALMRAAIANMRAGRNVQGGSTITQQVAKTLLLSNERTFARKARDILLALQMEQNLSKEDILYLYLNQIFFGQSSYGIEVASQTYFRKPAKQLTVPEAAILAGLPKAPSDFSPVRNPTRAKERQVYVLNRMADLGYITSAQAKEFIAAPLKVYLREDYEAKAPFYMETIRQLLVDQLGEDVILNSGVRIVAALDLDKQIAANEAVQKGLKEVDKRQGFRGPLQVFETEEATAEFLLKEKKRLISESNPERTILEDGSFAEVEIVTKKGDIKNRKNIDPSALGNLPTFLRVGKNYLAVVKNVNDEFGYAEIQLPDATGIIELETMTWARKVNFDLRPEGNEIKKPSEALKKGDQILVKIVEDKFAWKALPQKPENKKAKPLPIKIPTLDVSKHVRLELDQEPILEGSLLSIDQQSQDLLAMVGGYSFERNEYNRALQAARQTGSLFKALVYAAALEKNYNPSTRIIDAPIVYKQAGGEEGQGDEKIWSPSNHGKNFSGEITMRNALVQSLNIPSVKIIQDIGITFATDYSRRLGIFSKLNADFTQVLGSSSVTLYEMTKAFSQFGRNGLRTRPIIVKKVTDSTGKVILEKLSLDIRYREEVEALEKYFEQKRADYQSQVQQEAQAEAASKPAGIDEQPATPVDFKSAKKVFNPFFFSNAEQIIRPEVAYVVTDMLRGAVTDPRGTAQRAAGLARDIAGKTGSTNGYVDAWFIGYTAQVATGVWVGFDKERTIGKGEVGGKAALPIWLEFMKVAHENLPEEVFSVPGNIRTLDIDAESGRLANSTSQRVISQAYIEGSEPNTTTNRTEEATDYLKQDLED